MTEDRQLSEAVEGDPAANTHAAAAASTANCTEKPANAQNETHKESAEGLKSEPMPDAKPKRPSALELEKEKEAADEEQMQRHSQEVDGYMALKGWFQDEEVVVPPSPEGWVESIMTFLERAVRSGKFDLFFALIIVMNAGFMIARMEVRGRFIEDQVDLEQTHAFSALDTLTIHDSDFFDHADMAFFALFVVEILLRFLVQRLHLFLDVWALVDLLLCALAVFEMIMQSLPFQPTLLRLMRLLKLAKMIRMIRAMRAFRMLRVLARTIAASLSGLIWSIILLGALMMIGALVLCQMTLDHLEDPSVDEEVRRFIFSHFGSFGRSAFTIFQWTMGGNVPHSCRRLVEDVSPWFAIFVVLYSFLVSFALVRVIGAIFIKETLASAQRDAELVIEETLKHKSTLVRQLRALFREFDQNGNGMLDQGEFLAALEDERLQAWLSSLGLNVHETAGLFTLMDNGSGQLSCDELIAGAVRLRGDAKTVDVVSMMFETRKVTSQIQKVAKMIETCLMHTEDNGHAVETLRKQLLLCRPKTLSDGVIGEDLDSPDAAGNNRGLGQTASVKTKMTESL